MNGTSWVGRKINRGNGVSFVHHPSFKIFQTHCNRKWECSGRKEDPCFYTWSIYFTKAPCPWFRVVQQVSEFFFSPVK
jgi:hypothetical protein